MNFFLNLLILKIKIFNLSKLFRVNSLIVFFCPKIKALLQLSKDYLKKIFEFSTFVFFFFNFWCRKPESPISRPRPPIVEGRDGTPQKKKQCNCKHSRCLKLYISSLPFLLNPISCSYLFPLSVF